VGKRSPTRADLENTLKELAGAARSLRVLADYLEQHPDALLKGKGYKKY
jgi:paraquat-inducible protein B